MCLCCCYNICCCCNFCNSFSSKCIELTIFIFSLSVFALTLLDIIIIEWNHLSTSSFIFLIVLIVLSTITTISSFAIIMFRCKKLINKKRNSISTCLARIGFIFSIFSFILSIISESIIQSNFNELDYPCKSKKNQNDNENVIFFNRRILITNNDYCKDKDIDYNAEVSTNLERTVSYISATIIEFLSLILMFLWYNDLRRIKEKVDGSYGMTYVDSKMYKKRMNFGDSNEQQNGIDSSNKHINQNNSIQNHVILVKNDKNNKNIKARMSLPNLNFSKNQTNFIKNLREEMKEGIESIDEEDDSSENKDSQNQNHKISVYKGHNKHNNENKNHIKKDIDSSEKDNNTNVGDNKENSVESPNIFL